MIRDRAALKAEMADPAALGYAGKTPPEILALLTGPSRTRPRAPVSGQEIIAQLDATELQGMPDAVVTKLLDFLASQETIDLQDANVVEIFKKIFGAGPTRTNLIAFRDEQVSRLEEIGIGGVPTLHQIAVANGTVINLKEVDGQIVEVP